MPEQEEIVSVKVVAHAKNGKTILVETKDGEQAWIPTSQVEDLEGFFEKCSRSKDQFAPMTIPRWLAVDRGLAE